MIASRPLPSPARRGRVVSVEVFAPGARGVSLRVPTWLNGWRWWPFRSQARPLLGKGGQRRPDDGQDRQGPAVSSRTRGWISGRSAWTIGSSPSWAVAQGGHTERPNE